MINDKIKHSELKDHHHHQSQICPKSAVPKQHYKETIGHNSVLK